MIAEAPEVTYIESGKYRHYKGGEYEVLGIALNSETEEPLVVYRALYDSKVQYWVRPYDMFIDTVESGGKAVLRFTKI